MLHNTTVGNLTFVFMAAMNKVNGAQYEVECDAKYPGGNVSNLAEQCRVGADAAEQNAAAILSQEDIFRMRMESQCDQIKQYRLQVLRESGRLLSADEAALEWIGRFAASFDNDHTD
ncbi:Uncharacterised protein [Halioglobus japonicus]|nr:Uncharacterised protein [Halioglobus japonicus]